MLLGRVFAQSCVGKARDSEAKGGFKIGEATAEEKSEKKDLGYKFRGLAQVELLLPISLLVADLMEI